MFLQLQLSKVKPRNTQGYDARAKAYDSILTPDDFVCGGGVYSIRNKGNFGRTLHREYIWKGTTSL